MNQILDHSGPKKAKAQKNPADTAKIINVYAILIIIFAFCFFGKAAYSLTESKKVKDSNMLAQQASEPKISLFADNDIVSIDATYKSSIEEVTYQWYRGNATLDDIHNCMNEQQNNEENNEQPDENDDEETFEENEEPIMAIGNPYTEKGAGQSQVKIQNIGIPRGQTTLYVTVKITGNQTPTEYIQSYNTDVGIDKIDPKINVALQGKKLIITATDETEISYLTYSINEAEEKKIDEVENKKTIKAEVELDETQDTSIKICAVDSAKNTSIYDKTYELYVNKPKIDFAAENDFSKIYVRITYPKGIKKIEYIMNGESHTEEYDKPEENKEVNLEVPTAPGRNEITVRAYTKEEQVYNEDTGYCEYNP